ncbi:MULTISPECIES: hypothetical protein [Peribacillus]|uniref:hypothetical protein n=1 Tax=Peribacillus TaxID=2675229 RepID=UPI001F4EF02B|nr:MULTISPECIES: hypothetical protein [unclassified Peribacillus]MCK1982213.1 hypothetical protein [Peribacillus sp. Aquil_B1]MCK2007435.1 hypothetical protein [Peribacillus sp. Aquil_B8]
MIDYIFRHQKTGQEIKRNVVKEITLSGKPVNDLTLRIIFKIPRGYTLHQVVDYRTTAKERKVK